MGGRSRVLSAVLAMTSLFVGKTHYERSLSFLLILSLVCYQYVSSGLRCDSIAVSTARWMPSPAGCHASPISLTFPPLPCASHWSDLCGCEFEFGFVLCSLFSFFRFFFFCGFVFRFHVCLRLYPTCLSLTYSNLAYYFQGPSVLS